MLIVPEGSIDFSLISGRILLKEVKYHSSNQTVKILKAQIQWRYWIRRPATEKDIPSTQGEDSTCFAVKVSLSAQVGLQSIRVDPLAVSKSRFKEWNGFCTIELLPTTTLLLRWRSETRQFPGRLLRGTS